MSDIVATTNARDRLGQAIRILATALGETAEFQAFREAGRVLAKDDAAQELLRQVEIHRFALRWGQDDGAEHAAALQRLQPELESHASIQTYRRAEQAVQRLCRVVNTLISEAAGVDFTANAKRSCCG